MVRFGLGGAAPTGLTVDGHDRIAAERWNQLANPAPKLAFEFPRVEGREHPSERVMRRNTVPKHHEFPKPVDAFLGPRLDVRELVCVAQHRTVSNLDRSCLTWRELRGSEIETNTCASGITSLVVMGTPKDEETTQFQGL